MSEPVARVIVDILGVYAAVGAVFAVAFALAGAARVDPAAKGAPWTFRVLILPGAAALWPLLALRWVRAAAEPPEERTAHRRTRRAL